MAASISPANSSVRRGAAGAPTYTYTTAPVNSAPTATALEGRESVGIEAAISIRVRRPSGKHGTSGSQTPTLYAPAN